MTVFENVEFGLKMRGKPPAERKKSVNSVLRLVGLEGMVSRLPVALSGGERQKVALARVLATEPKVVLLDEPLASIDAEASRGLRDELKKLSRELGVAVLHVTHDQIEAFNLADKIAIMRNGGILQVGLPSEVLSKPVDEFVARFLGYENVFCVEFVKNERETSEVSIDGVSISLANRLESGVATVAIRPENIVIGINALSLIGNWNIFEGEVRGYVDLGPIVEVAVDAGLLLKAFIDKRSFLESNLTVGRRVHVGFRFDSVKVVSMT
jgi:ABC-type Fe3+/spermidine/putrescine transport system ATPase subunit